MQKYEIPNNEWGGKTGSSCGPKTPNFGIGNGMAKKAAPAIAPMLEQKECPFNTNGCQNHGCFCGNQIGYQYYYICKMANETNTIMIPFAGWQMKRIQEQIWDSKIHEMYDTMIPVCGSDCACPRPTLQAHSSTRSWVSAKGASKSTSNTFRIRRSCFVLN